MRLFIFLAIVGLAIAGSQRGNSGRGSTGRGNSGRGNSGHGNSDRGSRRNERQTRGGHGGYDESGRSGRRWHPEPSDEPKNLIFMISDGYGSPEQTLTRLVLEDMGRTPFMDEIRVGMAKTNSYDSWITESAAGATAYSCGAKTNRSFCGAAPDLQPCRTLLEAARDTGMKTGTVSTSRIQDATIAGWTAHTGDRYLYNDITIQQTYSGFDLQFGGGMDLLTTDRTNGGWDEESDGRNLWEEAATEAAGPWNRVSTYAEFEAADQLPLLGIFAESHMSQEIDREDGVEPSLMEMVEKALTLLSEAAEAEDTGFMLLIEGSNIDKRWHECDSVGAQFDAIMYDEVLEFVSEFAGSNGETLVVSTSDHECGGAAIGNVWDYERIDIYPEVFQQADHSSQWMANQITSGVMTLEEALQAGLGRLAEPVTQEEIDEVANANITDSYLLSNALSHIVNKRVNVGCLSDGAYKDRPLGGTVQHSGDNIPFFAYGPGVEKFWTTMENAEIGAVVADLLGLDIGVGAFPEGEEPEVAILDSQRTDSTLLSVKEHRAASRNAGVGEEPRSHH